MNSLIYRTLFYVNIYGVTNFQKTVQFFWPTLYTLLSLHSSNLKDSPTMAYGVIIILDNVGSKIHYDEHRKLKRKINFS